jgi:hypothetical protein
MSNFKEELDSLIKRNKGVRFVVHPTSIEQMDEMFSVMKKHDIIPIGPKSLEELGKYALERCGLNAAFEVNLSSYITSFNTVEHWKKYTKDIVEWTGERFIFLVD